MREVFEVIQTGGSLSVQDQGRSGWKKFGVPPGGVMDDESPALLNQLLGNDPVAPVLESLLGGFRLRTFQEVWAAVATFEGDASIESWRAVRLRSGVELKVSPLRRGVWSYVAIAGGFDSARMLDSVSPLPYSGLWCRVLPGTRLTCSRLSSFELRPGVAGRFISVGARISPGPFARFSIWPGPQFRQFKPSQIEQFVEQEFVVTPDCNRVGYRLRGVPIRHEISEMISEPTLVGSIQIPANGQPIVTMRDGPTVGGYPKIGLLDPSDLASFSQCRPGTRVKFVFRTSI